ncbi:MAG: TonB-dependent receptor family protein [Muribaculaceae bacterium]|nr:TonB-dependent receptor family protein [Muribaculaceae bacterium]
MKRAFVKRLFSVALVTLMSLITVAQDLSGAWKGNIVVQTYSIPIVLNLQQDGEELTATLDSPDQQAFGIKATAKVKGEKLEVTVPEIGASYSGKIDGNTLDGTYSQMGFSVPLKLTREVAVAVDDNIEINDSLLSVFDNIQLKEVEVTAQRQLIKQEVDRIGYNIEADADSKTNNVLTMLRKVPMVSVDASDEIRVNGQTNFKIFRNGHPDPSLDRNAKDILKAMPASSVKRIEVITEPGAKYDAEGTTMILNIVMADNSTLKGVSGMASARADHMGALGGSLNMTTQLDKVVLSIDYGIHHDRGGGQNYESSMYNRYTESGAELLGNTAFDVDKVTVHFGDVSASWEPDTLNLLSWSLSGFAYNYDGNGINSNLMRDAAGQPLYSYGMGNYTKADSYNFDTRMDYQHRTRLKGETVTLSYMLSAFRNKNKDNSRYTDLVNMPVPYYGIDQNGKENFNEHTFQLDWTRPLAEKHTLETGAKYIYRLNRSHNMLDYLGIDDDTDMRYKHVTQVGAAYVSYTFHSGPWDARAGLRYEHSYLRATYPDGQQDAYDAHLNDWVPSASLRYQFNWSNSLKLSYAASINRPGISFLNPAVIESPTSRSYGNTDLGSVHYHSVSMTYMHVGPKFTFNVTPQFQFSNNGIGAVKWADGLVQVSTYANTLKTYSTTLSAFVQWMMLQKTNLMFNGSIGYNYYKSKELGLKNDRISGNFFANVTQFLPWKLQLSGFAGLWGGSVNDLYGYMGTVFFHGFSLQRSFLKEDRLTVQLQAIMPFSGKTMSVKQYLTQGDVTGWTRYEQTTRKFGIQVSYRFGSLKNSVKKADKTIENDDLIGSGKQSGGSGNSPVGGGMGGGN